jgi:hypothetical protein
MGCSVLTRDLKVYPTLSDIQTEWDVRSLVGSRDRGGMPTEGENGPTVPHLGNNGETT